MEKTFTLKGTHLFSVFIFIVFVLGSHSTYGKSVILYTPYTKIAVPPGETIDYSIEVINNSSVIKNARISISGFPKEWTYSLKSGGWSFEEIAVLPGEKKTMTLQVEVPLKIEKGTYKFGVVAAGLDYLPLSVTISEQGTFKSEFISEQPNMEGHADASFTFNTELKNQTAEEQQYSLRARAPRGWSVKFKPNYKQATSVTVSPNSTETISIEVDPPSMVEAKTYKIPVEAVTASTSADLILEVVITGSYELNLTTPTGLLSTKATAGDERKVELLIKNTGSAELKDVTLSASKPAKWEVSFDPEKVTSVQPGQSAKVLATIVADQKAIPGDYVINMQAKTPEADSKAAFRVSVKTPMLWGWLGILIIAGVVVGVLYLFRKYGRR